MFECGYWELWIALDTTTQNIKAIAITEIIDYQKYPVIAAEHSTINRRSLGIGYIGLAHFLAKNKVKYDDEEAHELVHRLSEHFQFNLIKASVELATAGNTLVTTSSIKALN